MVLESKRGEYFKERRVTSVGIDHDQETHERFWGPQRSSLLTMMQPEIGMRLAGEGVEYRMEIRVASLKVRATK